MRPETIAVHTGVYQDQTWNSVTTPIYPSSTFAFDKLGEHRGFDYTRSGNPTRHALEENLAALEGGQRAVVTATGMAAVTTALFLFRAGDHVIAGNDIYGGTYRLFSQVFPRMGIEFSFIDMRDPQQVRDAVRENTRCLWIETPSNPLLNIIDIAAMVEIAREKELTTICDNTFLSPLLQQPLALGCDVSLHSTTKYINGHSDVVGGALIAREQEMGQRLADLYNYLGTSGSPFDAWLVLRGLKTLPQRMAAHEHNAATLAKWLQQHEQVRRVYYTGLEEHPQIELIRRQQRGAGGMLAFEIDAPAEKLEAFFQALKLFILAESLGGVESLIEQPWSMSHASMGEAGLRESGITPQTIRVSVGLEHPDDLIEDLERGFAAV
jgi:O-succinylhomoserine (thiol)-lyase